MPKALVVDDDQGLTTALALRLRAERFQTFTANSANEASRIALHERPHVIILDIDMPAFTGLEFQECLRFAERGRNIPVIFLSGQDGELNRFMAFRQGAAAFVAKPYEWRSLLRTIQNVIDAHQRHDPSSEPARTT